MSVDTNDLIAAIYAATLSPNDLPRVLEKLDNVLFRKVGDAASASPLDEVAEAHIRMARDIQARIGRTQDSKQRLAAIAESVPNSAHVISQSERVITSNAMALARQGNVPTRLSDVLERGDILSRVRDYLRRGEAGPSLAVAGRADPGQISQTSILVNRIDPSLHDGDENLFLLSIVDFGFDERVTDLFRKAYGLTQAEASVAVLLASGLRLPDIAEERRVSVETVRTQVKIIKSKTAVRDLPGLVRLVCGFSAGQAGQYPAATIRSAAEPLLAHRRVALRDGRQVHYLEQGAPDGRPVILFHNLPYGAELSAAALRQAHFDGLRIIAPLRPGMAGTAPVAMPGPEGQLNGAALDCLELMDLLGIDQAQLLGHSCGSTFALRFARLHPDRVSGIIAVSRAPAWKPLWVNDLPQRQRFMMRLSRFFPQVQPVVAWAMIACLESKFATEFVQYNCKDGAADVRASRDPETVSLIARGSIDALKSSVAAFCVETAIAQMDFTDEARNCRHKMHIIHGENDCIVPIAHSRTFANAVPGTSIEVVEGAGQLLFYSHWQRVLGRLAIAPTLTPFNDVPLQATA